MEREEMYRELTGVLLWNWNHHGDQKYIFLILLLQKIKPDRDNQGGYNLDLSASSSSQCFPSKLSSGLLLPTGCFVTSNPCCTMCCNTNSPMTTVGV